MSSFNVHMVRNFFDETNINCIFDIGAHNFTDSINLKYTFPWAEVYAFNRNMITHFQKMFEK